MTNADRVSTVSQNGDDHLKHIGIIEDGARVVFPQSGPLNSVAKNGPCQENPRSFPSGGFLLLNFEPPYRDGFACSLRLRGHRVVVPEEQGKASLNLTDDQIRNTDYLFCDLTRKITHDEFQELRRMCRLRRSDGTSIPKTCWVPQNWTAEFQRFIGGEFEAHVIPRTALTPSLPQETTHRNSNNENAPHTTREEGGAL